MAKEETLTASSRRDFLKGASAAILTAGTLGGLQTLAEAAQTKDKPKKEEGKLHVVIYLYDMMSALDAIGPYEVFRCAPDVRVQFVANKAGLITTDSKLQMLNAEASIDDVKSADVLLLPGGGQGAPMQDAKVLDWVRKMHETTKWTTGVCTGALILAAAGLLKGLEATTHWIALDGIKHFGGTPVHKRVVEQGKIITAAGVSAGIDMALTLLAKTHDEEVAKMVQLMIEYDPQPPYNNGSLDKASASSVEAAKRRIAQIYTP